MVSVIVYKKLTFRLSATAWVLPLKRQGLNFWESLAAMRKGQTYSPLASKFAPSGQKRVVVVRVAVKGQAVVFALQISTRQVCTLDLTSLVGLVVCSGVKKRRRA